MSKKEIKILLKYSDMYIAYAGKLLNILASGSSMTEVEKKLKKKNISDAIITYIPPVDKSFTPYGSN